MQDFPNTPAVRSLNSAKVKFTGHMYKYLDHGGTNHAASELGVPEHQVIKTLVMQTDGGTIILVLMHGDMEVSTKQLARTLGVKKIVPCTMADAQRHTGYLVGGISPFGTRKRLPVFAEKTILELPRVYINGGKRGFLVELDPSELRRVSGVTEVSVSND